mgnify:CR=1 FL=1
MMPSPSLQIWFHTLAETWIYIEQLIFGGDSKNWHTILTHWIWVLTNRDVSTYSRFKRFKSWFGNWSQHECVIHVLSICIVSIRILSHQSVTMIMSEGVIFIQTKLFAYSTTPLWVCKTKHNYTVSWDCYIIRKPWLWLYGLQANYTFHFANIK